MIWLLGHAEAEHQRAAAERAVWNIGGVNGVTDLVRLNDSPEAARAVMLR